MKISKKMLVAGLVMAGFAMQSSGMTVTEWCGQKSKDGGKTFYVNADTSKITKSLKIEFTPAEAAGDWSQILIYQLNSQNKAVAVSWNGLIQSVITDGATIPNNSQVVTASYQLTVRNPQFKIVSTTNPLFPSALPIDEAVEYTPTSTQPANHNFAVKAYVPASIVATTLPGSVNTTIKPANEDEGLDGDIYAIISLGNDIFVINPDAKSVSAYVSESKLVPVYSGKLTADMSVKLWGDISSAERAVLKTLGAVLYVGYGTGSGATAINDMMKTDVRLPAGNAFVGNAKFVKAITVW